MTHTTTKTIKTAYAQYKKSHLYSLNDCYQNASYNKQKAFNYCRELAHNYNAYLVGEPLKIISYNTNFFSVGFVGIINGRKAFFYITKAHNRFIYFEELEPNTAPDFNDPWTAFAEPD